MNKEEIAKKWVPCRCDEIYTSRGLTAPDCPYHSTDPEDAMDQYAKQVSIGFADWCQSEKCKYIPDTIVGRWKKSSWDENPIATEQLFQLYLNSIK